MEDNQQDVSAANSSSGDGQSGGSSSSSSGNSGGSSPSGARGIDSSGYTPGESKGARRFSPQVRYEEEYYPSSGARRGSGGQSQREQSYQQGNQPIYLVDSSNNNKENMKECNNYIPMPLGAFGAGLGYGGVGAIAPVAATGLGGDFYAFEAAKDAAKNACDAVEATKEAECSIKDSIMMSNSQRQTAELNLHNRLCEAEKAAITANYESRIAVKDSESRLMARIEECCCDMKLMNVEQTNAINEKFCDLERRNDKEFDRIREREDKREIAQLRSSLENCETKENNTELVNGITSGLLNALKLGGVIK